MSVMVQRGFDVALAEARGDAGRVVAVIGMRGGCGATTLATSLAWMIGNGDSDADSAERCILIDLDVHFGSAAMALGVTPGEGLLTMLAALRHSARWVVADVPRGLDAAARHVLRTADAVVLVTPPSLEGLRDTRRMLAWLLAWRPGAAPMVVVNGASAGGGEIRRKVFEETIGRPVAAWIGTMNGPASAAAAHALPLAAVAGGKGGNPFAALAAQVTGSLPAPRRPRLPEWWPGSRAGVAVSPA